MRVELLSTKFRLSNKPCESIETAHKSIFETALQMG
jgi:hypothetical protein